MLATKNIGVRGKLRALSRPRECEQINSDCDRRSKHSDCVSPFRRIVVSLIRRNRRMTNLHLLVKCSFRCCTPLGTKTSKLPVTCLCCTRSGSRRSGCCCCSGYAVGPGARGDLPTDRMVTDRSDGYRPIGSCRFGGCRFGGCRFGRRGSQLIPDPDVALS